MTPLAEGAAQMHELVLEYERAGFTRAESLHIVIELVKNAGNHDKPEDAA